LSDLQLLRSQNSYLCGR